MAFDIISHSAEADLSGGVVTFQIEASEAWSFPGGAYIRVYPIIKASNAGRPAIRSAGGRFSSGPPIRTYPSVPSWDDRPRPTLTGNGLIVAPHRAAPNAPELSVFPTLPIIGQTWSSYIIVCGDDDKANLWAMLGFPVPHASLLVTPDPPSVDGVNLSLTALLTDVAYESSSGVFGYSLIAQKLGEWWPHGSELSQAEYDAIWPNGVDSPLETPKRIDGESTAMP